MKKIAVFLFAAVTALVISTGTANADRGFWFVQNSTSTWTTYVNVTNIHATNTITATLTFYKGTDLAGPTTANTLGSTTRVMVPGAYWNFDAGSAIDTTSLTTNTLNANVRGSVKLTSSDSASAQGWFTVMDNSKSAGFNFRLPITE
ncbi:MAG: hypothetical protein HZA04_05565 [Nitrospinae bacterium]|nr:hypothetical protein [Nitrospinota bacterium]